MMYLVCAGNNADSAVRHLDETTVTLLQDENSRKTRFQRLNVLPTLAVCSLFIIDLGKLSALRSRSVLMTSRGPFWRFGMGIAREAQVDISTTLWCGISFIY